MGRAGSLAVQRPSALGLVGHVGRPAAVSALRQGARLWGHDTSIVACKNHSVCHGHDVIKFQLCLIRV